MLLELDFGLTGALYRDGQGTATDFTGPHISIAWHSLFTIFKASSTKQAPVSFSESTVNWTRDPVKMKENRLRLRQNSTKQYSRTRDVDLLALDGDGVHAEFLRCTTTERCDGGR